MEPSFTIIAATSFSKLSDNAVVYAAEVAKATGAHLLLYNAFNLPTHSANSSLSAEGLQKQIDRATTRLTELASGLSEAYNISTSSVCSYAFLEDHLSVLIDETRAELVVMGMPERSLEQDLLGNPTTMTIKSAKVPVLAVPIESRFDGIQRVLFACDTFRPLSLKKIAWLRDVVGQMGLEIEVFSVDKTIDDLKAKNSSMLVQNILEEEFQKVKYLYKSVRSNAVISEIEKEIILYKADVLVMMPQQYGFWDSLVHRSKTRLMASGLQIPLLSIPNL